MAKPGA